MRRLLVATQQVRVISTGRASDGCCCEWPDRNLDAGVAAKQLPQPPRLLAGQQVGWTRSRVILQHAGAAAVGACHLVPPLHSAMPLLPAGRKSRSSAATRVTF